MFQKIVLIFILIFSLLSCSKNEITYEPQDKVDAYELYREGYNAFERGDYFFANKKFSEAELNFQNIDYAAKAALMSSYALYGINFYEAALENLNRYLKKYPSHKNVIYDKFFI